MLPMIANATFPVHLTHVRHLNWEAAPPSNLRSDRSTNRVSYFTWHIWNSQGHCSALPARPLSVVVESTEDLRGGIEVAILTALVNEIWRIGSIPMKGHRDTEDEFPAYATTAV